MINDSILRRNSYQVGSMTTLLYLCLIAMATHGQPAQVSVDAAVRMLTELQP